MACREAWAGREESISVPGAGDTGPRYLAPRKDQLGKKRMGPNSEKLRKKDGSKLRAAPEANIPMSPQGRHCWPPTQPCIAQAYVFPILSVPHLCLKYSQPPSCPNSPSLVSPPPRPFPDSLSQSVPPSPMPTTDHFILWGPQAKYRAGKTGVRKWLLEAQPLQASALRPLRGRTSARPAHLHTQRAVPRR